MTKTRIKDLNIQALRQTNLPPVFKRSGIKRNVGTQSVGMDANVRRFFASTVFTPLFLIFLEVNNDSTLKDEDAVTRSCVVDITDLLLGDG